MIGVILFLIFVPLLILLIAGLGIIRYIYTLFGKPMANFNNATRTNTQSRSKTSNTQNKATYHNQPKNNIDAGEGKYIDFEEIKQ